jgi:hypothetical protein
MLFWLGKVAVVSFMQVVLYYVLVVWIFAQMPRTTKDYEPALFGLLIVGMALAIVAVATRQMYILGLHKNSLGQSLACTLMVAFELLLSSRTRTRQKALLFSMALLSAGLFFSMSRGGWMAAGLGITFILVLRKNLKLLLQVVVVIAPVIALCWQLIPAERKSYVMEISGERKFSSYYFRLENIKWAKARFEKSPVFGSGLGIRKLHDATNLVWYTLAETGIVGLVAFTLLHGSIFWMVFWTARKLQPREDGFSGVALGGAIILGKLAHGMLDHFWSRGHLLIACAAIGMATRAYFLVRDGRVGQTSLGTRSRCAQVALGN